MSANSISSLLTATLCIGAFLIGIGAILEQCRRKRRRDLLVEDHEDCCNNLSELFPAPRRFGAAILLKREQYQRYRDLHDAVWDQVLERMYQSNIRNFAIYYHSETSTMFQSFEWIGHWKAITDKGNCMKSRKHTTLTAEEERVLLDRDMAAIANDPITRTWWKECEPCQQPFAQWDANNVLPSDGGTVGNWWAPMECLCHTGHWPTAYSRQRRDPDFVKLAR
jgi:L-rhamnose mutarotase